MAVPHEILLRDPRVSVALCSNVLVTRFRGMPDTEILRLVQSIAKRAARRHPVGIGSLVTQAASLADPHPSPPEDTRDEFRESMKEVGDFIRATAVVVETRGFVAATMRTFIAGVGLLGRLSYPLKTFDAIDPAATWMASRMAPVENADQLAAALRVTAAAIV